MEALKRVESGLSVPEIAEELALARPERIISLVLATTSVGPYMLKISILQAWARQALAGMSPMTFFQIMLPFMFNDRCFEDPQVVEMAVGTIAARSSTPPHILARQMTACAEHDARDRIGRITAPTLVLAGKEDPFVPFSLSQELAASIPGAQLKVLEGGGHAPHDDGWRRGGRQPARATGPARVLRTS